MCGLCGSLAFDGGVDGVEPALLERMRDTMVHRGPDGAGLWVSPDGRVGLGHRRLAIIDLSTEADQPMLNEDGTLCLVFNGEIYNHAELRHELEATGRHRWRTDHSDTEVILHSFEEWGIDCLERFRGMFALAIWDERAGELWLARDRIGIKPLYYAIHGDRVSFASEIKALLVDPRQRREIDPEALYHYLSFLTTPAPMTLFKGIRKIPGGCWVRVGRRGDVTEHRYWDVWDRTEPLVDASDEDIAGLVLEELRTSVRYRKVSDVPVGVFLSGGIDSSTNTALFSEGEDKPVQTFTIGFEGDYPSYRNELSYARQMAEHVGSKHHELLLTEDDLLNLLPRMVHLQDEPIADPVCVPVYYVSKLARDHGVVVCQVGEGADELFWGYEGWKRSRRLAISNDQPVPAWVKRLGLRGLRLAGLQDDVRYELLRRGASGLPVFWGGAEAFTESQKQKLLSPTLRRSLSGLSSWDALEPIHRRFKSEAWDTSHLSWMSYLDLNLRLPELLLMRVDKMSMGVSLEARVPFLDHRLVELAMSIPEPVKTRGGELKAVLKRAVRGTIPDELIDRPKQGFGVPIHEWLLGRLGERAREELEGFCQASDILDADAVRDVFEGPPGPQPWHLLNLALWWQEFVA